METLPNRNEVRLPSLARAAAPYEPRADAMVDELAGNVITCSLGSFLLNRYVMKVTNDKWAVAAGVLLPFVAGAQFNRYVADLPKRAIAAFEWRGYRVAERYSINPRN